MASDARDTQARGKLPQQAIILALVIVVAMVLITARFVLSAPSPQPEGPGSVVHLTGAPPFGTVTPTAAAPINVGTQGTAIAGEQSWLQPIVPGFPDPTKDTSAEQAMRANLGNPAKIIMVSLSGEFLQAFDHGKLIRWAYVTTGKPTTPTDVGVFHVFSKQSPVTFLPISNNPSSPEFGFPSKVQYGLEYEDGGFFIHDVWWRTVFGPGTNVDHWDVGRAEPSPGSHGCVNTPLPVVQFLFFWAPIGTPVVVFE
jgi:lipoprotein-anchoring transpeptidase ErfK/SrfK